MSTRTPLQVSIQLNHLHCLDEGDGPGNAEPYLWTLFYKIDGDTFRFGNENDPSEQLLRGAITVERRNGGHGNLHNTDVDEGDTIAIPPEIGKWETILQPIPVAEVNKSLVARFTQGRTDLPGLAGVVTILMEEDNLPDDSAVAGYNAFCSTFETKMNELINGMNLVTLAMGISEEMENGIESAIREAVESTITGSINIFELAWNWIAGPDQTLGSATFRFNHDDLASTGQILFKERWKNGVSVTTPADISIKEFIVRGPGRVIESGGEWEIFGTASATPVEIFMGSFGPPIQLSQSELAIMAFRHRNQIAGREGYPGGFPTFKSHRDQYGNEYGSTVFLKHEAADWSNVSWFAMGLPGLEDFIARMRAAHVYARKMGYVSGFPTFYEKQSILDFLRPFDRVNLNQVARIPKKAGERSQRRVLEMADNLSNHLAVNEPEEKLPVSAIRHQTFTTFRPDLSPALMGPECATLLIQAPYAEVQYIRLEDLGNPKLGDIQSRFIAVHDYAIQHGYAGGYPTFFERNMSFEISGFDLRCETVLIKKEAAEVKNVMTFKVPA